MGVEYVHYLMPRQNGLLPSPEQLEHLIAALYQNRWLMPPDAEAFSKLYFETMSYYEDARESGCVVTLSRRKTEPVPYPMLKAWFENKQGQDLRICWPVENFNECEGLRYPFNQYAGYPDAEEIYYNFEIQLSSNYIHRCSEIIEPLSCKKCECGEELEFYEDDEPFFSGKIHRTCPKCMKFFDAVRYKSKVRNGWGYDTMYLDGGATSCFALAIDCGKCIPKLDDAITITIHPELKQLVEQSLSVPCYEQYDIY